MDIPAPTQAKKEETVDEAQPTAVAVNVKTATAEKPTEEKTISETVTRKEEPKPTEAGDKDSPKKDLKDAEFAALEEKRKALQEMITSKKYELPIKEKRSRPLLTFGLIPKKSRRSKKKKIVKKEQQQNKPKSHQKILIIVLVVVVIGAVLAIDAGMIDIGVKLPFDLIKNV